MPSLTRTEAVARADLIAVQEYRIDLDLTDTAASDGFDSTTTVLFSCHRPGGSTFVELKPSRLDEIRLNGVALDVAGLEGNRFPLTDLAGQNELVVRSRMRTSNTGEGLHRFVYPEDGSVYLYAQAFMDDAQRMFACFDRPDLKARISLAVTAPAGWQVAGNGVGAEVSRPRGRRLAATWRPECGWK